MYSLMISGVLFLSQIVQFKPVISIILGTCNGGGGDHCGG